MRCPDCQMYLHDAEIHTKEDCIRHLRDLISEQAEKIKAISLEIQRLWTRGHGPLVLD